MAVYHLDDIAGNVRIALDQNMNNENLEEIGDVDTLSLNDIIRSKITEAVKHVHSSAPYYLLDGGHNFGGGNSSGNGICWNDDGTGWILLPEDFMRFVVFQMDDWVRPVFFPISTDDTEYEKQTSRFKGIRGNPSRPVCVISMRPEGRTMEFYSCKSKDAKISRAVYIPYPKIDDSGGVEICCKCYDAVVYTAAALTVTAYGDTERVSLFNELAKSALI